MQPVRPPTFHVPCTESYLSRYATDSMGVMSFICGGRARVWARVWVRALRKACTGTARNCAAPVHEVSDAVTH